MTDLESNLRHAIVSSAPKTSATSIGARLRVGKLQATVHSLADESSEHKHCLQPGCDFDSPLQVALDAHLEQDHFQCVGCKRIFQSQNKLNQHSESCNFDVPCPQCCEPYAGQAQLAFHLEHCYLCEDCGFCTHHEGNFKIVSDGRFAATGWIKEPVLTVPAAYDKTCVCDDTVLGLRCPDARILRPHQPS